MAPVTVPVLVLRCFLGGPELEPGVRLCNTVIVERNHRRVSMYFRCLSIVRMEANDVGFGTKISSRDTRRERCDG